MTRPTFYDPGEEITVNTLWNLLMLVSVMVAELTIGRWTKFERLVVYDWAMREHLSASDNIVQRRSKPWLVSVGEVR